MKIRCHTLGNRNLIGFKVTQLRKQANMKQKELAEQMQLLDVDMNYTSLSKLEGQSRIVTDKELIAIAKIFHTTPNELLDFH